MRIAEGSQPQPRWSTAVILGKHVSSVYRELNRTPQAGLYTAGHVHRKAEQRRYETKPSPKSDNASLMAEVKKRFKEDWSPDQIAGRLAMEKAGKTVSHETIYGYLYRELKRKPALRARFRHPRRKRISRTGRKDLRGQIPDRVIIEKRPAIADKKVSAGDWEADSVEGAGKTGYAATFVDKMTKYLVAKVMRNKATATLSRPRSGRSGHSGGADTDAHGGQRQRVCPA